MYILYNMCTHILPLNSNNVYIWRNLELVRFFLHHGQQIRKSNKPEILGH